MLLFHDFGYLLAQYIGFGSVSAKKVNHYAVRPVLYFIFFMLHSTQRNENGLKRRCIKG